MLDTSTGAARLRWPSFGVQVLIGMIVGVLLGLLARSLPGGEDSGLAQALHTIGQS